TYRDVASRPTRKPKGKSGRYREATILLARAGGEGGGGDWPPPSCARCRDVKGKREPEGAQRFTGLKKGLTD
ncbi:MAG TPA: hypothetical protein VGI71_19845, partial [Scandinavium sp.]